MRNQSGSVVTLSTNKWPGEYMMSMRFADGWMNIMFIKDVEEEMELLKGEGYVEAN